MTAYLLAGPAEEPVSLDEVRDFLKIDGGAEDGLLATLVAAARVHIESTTAHAMIAQTWRLALDAWPQAERLPLPVAPIFSIEAMTAYDPEGEPTEIDQSQVVADTRAGALLLPVPAPALPGLRQRHGIEIDYVAGYGSTPAEVPADLRQAVLGLAAYWYENRGMVLPSGGVAVVPPGFDRLIAAYRRRGL